jgi:glycosyltransferase involved in cell wall biosynthesis
MRVADADVYFQSSAAVATGIAAWFCARHDRRFVLRIVSDANCIPGKQLIRYWRDRKLYEYGLRRAHLVAAQTDYQQQLLKTHYGVESVLVNMAVEPSRAATPPRKDIDVLWVSNLRHVKRPDRVMELAKLLPHIRFTMVGGAVRGEEEYYAGIEAQARALSNVEFLGGIPYADVGDYFDRAKLFLNTSDVEGFPNTFLQAWIRSIPVVTLFDPDRLVRERGLGIAVDSLPEMAEALNALMSDESRRNDLGRRSGEFCSASYSAEQVAARYLELLGGRSR